ncbi:MAG: Sir2 family NAD-dependent protein deacetylase [Chloroflexi bacterium]|nr:Sir2 family NAD-dependent protein deacetylase [Chloroflexota bacterium]
MTTTAEVARWIADARSVVALTGAGISTESGIPDFRGPDGVWTRDPRAERLSNIGYYVADPRIRREAWQRRADHPAWSARANPGHRALVDLERAGRLDVLVTQNIDGLHLAAGTSMARLIEIHGTIRETACLTCGDRRPMRETLQRVRDGDPDPACLGCGGILKSATISFGQNLDPGLLARAESAAARADVLLAVGTSLSVYPVARLPELTLAGGGRVVILNAEPTPLDASGHAVLAGRAGEVLPALVDAVVTRMRGTRPGVHVASRPTVEP